jgi:hypothetical protein
VADRVLISLNGGSDGGSGMGSQVQVASGGATYQSDTTLTFGVRTGWGDRPGTYTGAISFSYYGEP